MKKLTGRAVSVLLIICFVIAGMAVYLVRFIENGQDWALYFYRANSGSTGMIYDRNGIVLADFSPKGNFYSNDPMIRKACFHIIGDYSGRTGSGLLTSFGEEIKEYDIFSGTTEVKNYDFTLTLDADLSREALIAMGEYRGCILVSNYRTGEILIMVSTPTIDPLEEVTDPEEGTFLNKCISGTYTPGSVFKLVTAASAIEDVPNIFEKSFWCENEYDVAGVTITCLGPHYTTDFYTALSNSCNCAFAQISVMTGQESIKRHVEEYGFTQKHDVNGIPVSAGNFETGYMGDPELAWAGIGQWTDQVCPFAMLRFIQATANGGIIQEPFVIAGTNTSSSHLIREDTASVLKEMMAFNVKDHYGPENFPDLKLCAKTGTAEVGDGTNNAWFAGFLDDEEHPYAFVVIAENGGFGINSAGMIANSILQYAVNRD